VENCLKQVNFPNSQNLIMIYQGNAEDVISARDLVIARSRIAPDPVRPLG
jgi:hypothetical protein